MAETASTRRAGQRRSVWLRIAAYARYVTAEKAQSSFEERFAFDNLDQIAMHRSGSQAVGHLNQSRQKLFNIVFRKQTA